MATSKKLSSNSVSSSIITAASHLVNLKLTIENYPLWKAQIVPFLKGHKLFGHVDGSHPMPEPLLANEPNPAYDQWLLQDQLIISAINSSLSESVLTQVLDCTTSQQVWSTLQNLYSAQSSAHLMNTQFQLATLKKGAESITEYYNKAKNLSSQLDAAGHSLLDSEFTIFLLAGLGTDYESLVTSLTTRPDPLTPHQLYSYLLNHESRLSHQTNSLLSNTSISANNTAIRPPSSPRRGRSNNFRGGRRGRGFGRGNTSSRGSGPSSNFFINQSDNRPLCQVCHKPGHTALLCYHRFNHSYQASPPPNLAAHFTAIPHSTTMNSSWFPDTAATHHFTPDYNNLNLDSVSYQGSDQVSIGDGSSLPIQNIGTAQLHSSTGNFLLTQLLHVPSISKNLLSVRQFCQDNNVFFKFHCDHFVVKDSRTRVTLLQGPVEGLYVFPSSAAATASSSLPQALLTTKTTNHLWHLSTWSPFIQDYGTHPQPVSSSFQPWSTPLFCMRTSQGPCLTSSLVSYSCV
ncbi:hypothetical protein F2P56_035516 [Juglans regia]|uniref:Retrovirus-related Pol polyprotein from transposon TNT 1-94-like beta-barrel domain-containing protein n=1 Tax=Juglans regia TaxID=51240 RepID=A0A833TTV7_JUGRE|nr:hypothetical protein F2P56_035516 [Juglans regia]